MKGRRRGQNRITLRLRLSLPRPARPSAPYVVQSHLFPCLRFARAPRSTHSSKSAPFVLRASTAYALPRFILEIFCETYVCVENLRYDSLGLEYGVSFSVARVDDCGPRHPSLCAHTYQRPADLNPFHDTVLHDARPGNNVCHQLQLLYVGPGLPKSSVPVP